jgi:hypothetical protein
MSELEQLRRENATLRRELLAQTGGTESDLDALLRTGKPVCNRRVGSMWRRLFAAEARVRDALAPGHN